MQYSISATAFLAIFIVIRLRRRTESRSRTDEAFTVFTAVVFGVLIAATSWGHAILQLVGIAVQVTH
ncbi:hypothetical protein BX285_6840 [Streptomyces sp. 1114.5]|uniref:hypothetical protein n=1 Tax=unclassified Streptomyces TaxID=2593676 RepID=UPI000BD2F11B|nr:MULTISPECIES: hypothetical protein [unclassified Streptomyces]RKT09736.1 hypothetical protein BX285_6840 [Streptomyces sp. 1114.5]SOB88914.1 hypothetical protein SAMN06272789_7236 [Streptomyces sp. 1331.2]